MANMPAAVPSSTPSTHQEVVDESVATATMLLAAPRGTIGYVEASASQSTITTSVDLTSLTVSVTVGTSRRIKITCKVTTAGTVADNGTALQLKESATSLGDGYCINGVVGIGTTLIATTILTPTAGAHTYKAAMALLTGTGSVSSNYTALTSVPYLLVEDIGAA